MRIYTVNEVDRRKHEFNDTWLTADVVLVIDHEKDTFDIAKNRFGNELESVPIDHMGSYLGVLCAFEKTEENNEPE